MTLADYGLGTVTFATAWLCWQTLGRLSWFDARSRLRPLCLLPVLLLTVPIGSGLFLIHGLHGFFGALSVGSVALMAASLLLPRGAYRRAGCLWVYGWVVVMAWPLYISAEGFLGSDLYAQGYSGIVLPALVSVSLLIAVGTRHYLGAFVLTAAVLVYSSGLHPSTNLFDVLFDTPLVLFASAALLRKAAQWLNARAEQQR